MDYKLCVYVALDPFFCGSKMYENKRFFWCCLKVMLNLFLDIFAISLEDFEDFFQNKKFRTDSFQRSFLFAKF